MQRPATERVCPDCGDFRFGSSRNEDDTWTRKCSGQLIYEGDKLLNRTMPLREVYKLVHEEARKGAFDPTHKFPYRIEYCSRTWHQSQDAENGLVD
jgi:hypothetical protein